MVQQRVLNKLRFFAVDFLQRFNLCKKEVFCLMWKISLIGLNYFESRCPLKAERRLHPEQTRKKQHLARHRHQNRL